MYDLVVIGAGWAGFNACLRAKALGLAVCLIDANQIGGTCLNYGCIPTKTLIACAKVFSLAKKSSNFGIQLDHLSINWAAIQEKKEKVVRLLAQGMRSRISGIDFINSPAQIISAREIKVDGRLVKTKSILVATGSRPVQLPGLIFDQNKVISSNEALSLSEIPQSLLVIGGGVIGCEFASLFSSLGSLVTIAEKMPLLLAAEDRDISRKIEVIFKKKGIKVVTGADISSLNLKDYSKVLVCVGRTPNIEGLGLEALGVELKNNKILVDEYLKTNIDNIYAAGDCTGGSMLAHYAAYQGVTAVENIISPNRQKADNRLIPACIFTDPQIASVGVKENDYLADGLRIKINKFDFRASAMANIIEETDGFVKIITDGDAGRIIGASIIGPQATELISVLVMGISCQLTANQVKAMIFAHPTFSESIRESLN
ncbi:MAG TPA: dihydrolipoyl dehydrogenase [Candidatus Omnitrophota bacterium]|nr:dihydrolipoyl dehydrogenase [Candidatus Omnitrophota bacterium]HPT39303.1 dihydrolipoyl dehydrogenase [Candidatus Omnitrophota bacterium]